MACNQLFEKGFLSHEKITKDNREAMESIHKGMEFVFSWYRNFPLDGSCQRLLKNGSFFHGKLSTC